jgi:hypothetical protein
LKFQLIEIDMWKCFAMKVEDEKQVGGRRGLKQYVYVEIFFSEFKTL